jgi:hypothetical protein
MGLLAGMMDMARHDLAVATPADMAPSADTVIGISFIGCGMALGLVLLAIGAAGPLSPVQADQLWMMSFGLLFVLAIGAALTGAGLGDTDPGTFFAAAFVLLILAPSNILWRHVFDPHEEANVRVLLGLVLLVPNFFVYRVIEAVASRARPRRRSGRAPSPYPTIDGREWL